ncbi:MAG: glutamyl-tRNA amidotransferase [Candidatus Thiodiazotropha sp. (ex Lucinoma borealis)]|nr:glutamyl-tRNA amidotransferase [Candidatus Thiodiazotropha sp. (ex Lucinoma borealis)]MCU7839585.1 glutamyl-tRNA amidotransferase [Candidatus Thiodiazotropha sp. (ex Troendleina suluensis)]MCU7865765.1 glutamyl-tRNA amidotransferase [Candidatus Thiodiazotropha sp. (ex Lucinoma borealis)]MCU7869518.1 glutamyl-tRNA amidotransferase [Candidatus Thiodiazotropha sp. (ex Lucinoma borealis)]MCU7947828.1 glutamyl-tRNA amidotransferase [Candidatus Thiodiazotropha sp. (ex Cardiolucina cf. quadrata)]
MGFGVIAIRTQTRGYRVKRSILPLVLFLLISACQEMEGIDMSQVTPQEKSGVESLLWLKNADPEKSAQQALARGDKRLMAMASRTTNLPGIEPELVSKAKSICGVRYLEGSTDTVLGEIHLKLIQAASEYAASYNRIIIDHCMEK